jgi:hypothetical protein
MDGDKKPSEVEGSRQFKTDNSLSTLPSGEAITWTASEFIAHQKNGGWYGILAAGAVVVAVLVWFVTKDVVSSVVIVVAAAMLASFAARQPRELTYALDSSGLTIGVKRYPYSGFRSFAVMQEGAATSIVFMPLKRFAPMTTIYYDPEDEEKIGDIISEHLPFEERKRDAIDRLMWRIRF